MTYTLIAFYIMHSGWAPQNMGYYRDFQSCQSAYEKIDIYRPGSIWTGHNPICVSTNGEIIPVTKPDLPRSVTSQ